MGMKDHGLTLTYRRSNRLSSGGTTCVWKNEGSEFTMSGVAAVGEGYKKTKRGNCKQPLNVLHLSHVTHQNCEAAMELVGEDLEDWVNSPVWHFKTQSKFKDLQPEALVLSTE
jgi:hypothetical protein